MKPLFSILFLCVLGISQAQSGAKITFETPTFDFGEIPEGPKVETFFKFKNTGSEPLIISNARGSCGCTVPQWPKEPILPNQEATIKVVYNTAGRLGSFIKSVTLTSNAVNTTEYINIKGKVVAESEEETLPIKTPTFLSPNN